MSAKLGMRTRQPIGSDVPTQAGAPVTAAVGSVAVAATLNGTLTSGTAGENGYATGNSEWMHMSVICDGAETFTIWAWSHQMGRWSELQLPVANTAVATSYAPATFTTAGAANQYFIVPVRGVDRVAFVSTDTPDIRIAFNNF